MQRVQPIPFDQEQFEFLAQARDAADRLDRAMSARADYIGGMQWKAVKGIDYLMRYWTGDDGKKTARSLGPRSPETEAKHSHFLAERKKALRESQSASSHMERAGRMAKALRMGRVPAKVSVALTQLRAAALTTPGGPLAVGDAAALACIENRFHHHVPIALHREDEVLQVVNRGDENVRTLAERIGDALLRHSAPREFDMPAEGRARLVLPDGLVIEAWTANAVLDRVDELHAPGEVADAVIAAFDRDGFDGVAFGRNSAVVLASCLSPAAYALVAPLMAEGGHAALMAGQRSMATEALARAGGRHLSREISEAAEMAREAALEGPREMPALRM
ncbi:MAG: hypothetical protein INR68_11315 [Methylobacterium mesophilicum]|nr:hypothetical protein [Methylobacterium mesophilicum]